MKRRPILYLPTTVRVTASGWVEPTLRRGVIPEWHLVARRTITGVPLPPLCEPLGEPITDAVDVLVDVPQYCCRLVLVWVSGLRREEKLPAVSPILLVEPDRHNPAKGWFDATAPRLTFRSFYGG